MFKFLIFTALIWSACAKAPTSNSPLVPFKQYLLNAQKLHAQSQNRLINQGDSFLIQHAVAAERLSLAEMLPISLKEFPKFCKAYPQQIVSYYNLENAKQIKTIKSSVFPEFNTLVATQCQRLKHKK